MNRRSFFTLIAAAVGARKLPARPTLAEEFRSGVAIMRQFRIEEAVYFRSINAANWAAMRPAPYNLSYYPPCPPTLQFSPRPKIGNTITVKRPERYRA